MLGVISQNTLSQAANREPASNRFVELLRDAVRQVPVRKKTLVIRAANLRRLEEKKQRSVLKSKMPERVPVEE
ncbi:MAG: hypothetical protein ABSC04_12680 [Syntrophobacteraceae bacterium]|jgi:hypothetical protein